MKHKINRKLIAPAILAVIIYLLSYQIPKITIPYDRLHYLNTYIDTLIPLRSHWIVIYVLAFLQWIYGIQVILRQETYKGYKFISSIIIGSLIGFIIYMVYPNAIVRAEITINNIFDQMLILIYSVDNIINACPSFHCFCSTMIIIVLVNSSDIKKKTIIFNVFFSILVFASTLLTKQHVIIDVPAGILLAILAYKLTDYISLNNLYIKINKLIFKK